MSIIKDLEIHFGICFADSERHISVDPKKYFEHLKRTRKNLAAAHLVEAQSSVDECFSPDEKNPQVSVCIAYFLGADETNIKNLKTTMRALKK